MNRTKVKLWQKMLLFGALLLVSQQLFSQIKGKVSDANGTPIPGVTILEKGTSNGVISDFNGMYQLKIQKAQGAVLVFSFVGMESQEIPATGKSTINVTMNEVTQAVDEVVIVGYGAQKKATVTGAITSINAAELIKSPTGSLTTALAGRLPGLITMQRSGQPGAESPTLRIRGVSTLNGADPLVIVDGIERSSGYVPSGESAGGGGISGYEQINPNDIESISILKDASSTAVYGVRGANGVIIITTKKGVRGKPKI